MSPDGTVVPAESQVLSTWVKRIRRVHEFQSEWAEAVIRKFVQQFSGLPLGIMGSADEARACVRKLRHACATDDSIASAQDRTEVGTILGSTSQA